MTHIAARFAARVWIILDGQRKSRHREHVFQNPLSLRFRWARCLALGQHLRNPAVQVVKLREQLVVPRLKFKQRMELLDCRVHDVLSKGPRGRRANRCIGIGQQPCAGSAERRGATDVPGCPATMVQCE